MIVLLIQARFILNTVLLLKGDNTTRFDESTSW